MTDAPGSQVAIKRRRITRACDRCHASGAKCVPSTTLGACELCLSNGFSCVYKRPVKRRGSAPRVRPNTTQRFPASSRPVNPTVRDVSSDWEYREIADHQTILQLADFYYHIVYPILLYIHWPTFSADLLSQRYIHDRSFYAFTMAVCATASTRIREKAPLPPSITLNITLIPPAKTFYEACLGSICQFNVDNADFNILRTEALLGMLDLQYDDLGGCLTHLHRYFAMSAEYGFHDEANWPLTLSEIEIQERRRLFWQCYHFGVYLAITFGVPLRQRESQCYVKYPAEVYDDEDYGIGNFALQHGRSSFIRGWNFVTDLYRVLEHLNELMRSAEASVEPSHSHLNRLLVNLRVNKDGRIGRDMLAAAQRDLDSLPAELKVARPMTGNKVEDRYGFQGGDTALALYQKAITKVDHVLATNIIITMTTVKMVLTKIEGHDLAQRCSIAGEMLDNLSTIPTIYVQSTSTAMLHHLAGVGHLLSPVTHDPLSQWAYLQARSALLAVADLVDSLEAILSPALKISSKLREHIHHADLSMKDIMKTSGKKDVLHSALPKGAMDMAPEALSQEENIGDTNYTSNSRSCPLETDPNPKPTSDLVYSPAYLPSHLPSMPGLSACLVQFPDEDNLLEWPRDSSFGSAFEYLGGID